MSRSRKCRLNLESLEARQMMAGDVDATLAGGTLTISGDGLGNGLAIHNSSPGTVTVRGLSQAGSATTIDGQATANFTNVKNILVSLNGGDDQLVLTDLSLKGSVNVLLGEGADNVGLGNFDDSHGLFDNAVDSLTGELAIQGNLTIGLGEGSNTLVARGVTVGKLSTISAGSGTDLFEFEDDGTIGQPGYVPAFNAGKGLTLTTGNGANTMRFRGATLQNLIMPLGSSTDIVSLENVNVAKNVLITGLDGANEYHFTGIEAKSIDIISGSGGDEYELEDLILTKSLRIIDALGDDVLNLDDSTAKSVELIMGGGEDDIILDNVTLSGSLDIDTGLNDDTVTLNEVTAKSINISLGLGNDTLTATDVDVTKSGVVNAGDGNDEVDIDQLNAKELSLLFGLGDDDLIVEHVAVAKKVTLDGGAGDNSFTDNGSFTYGKLKKNGFPVVG